MPTPTTRLGLLKPSTADVFSTADIAKNWQTLDDNPGTFICTSSTRPTWNSAKKGREILETDTMLKWLWDGAKFVRLNPKGLLTTTSGAWARGQRTTDYSTTSTSYGLVVSINNVVVPPGNRTLMITVNWSKAENTAGYFYGAIFRSNVSNQEPRIGGWALSGDSSSPTAGAQGSGASFVTFEPGGLAAGTYSWSFQIASSSLGGTSTIRGNATQPTEIAVIEI